MSKMGQELEKRLDENKYAMYEALKQIARGEGRFSIDHLTHAENTIEAMLKIANEAIAKVESKGK